jgi:phosphohistidine swiveling domain-containing protein
VDPWTVAAEPALPCWAPPTGRDRVTAFTPADRAGRWALDFHTPRGLVPLVIALVDDLAAGAVAAADELGLPGGLQARLVGCHLYVGVVPRDAGVSRAETTTGEHAGTPQGALPADLTAYVLGFRARWAALSADLTGELDDLDAVDLTGLSQPALLAHWRRARALHARAWRIHFDVMYRLMTVHEHYVAVCRRHGVPDVDAARMIEGESHVIGDADRAVRALAEAAREGGFARLLLRTPTTRVLAELRREPAAQAFVADLARVQARYGRRTSALFDLESAPWSADATAVLALVRSALVAGPPKRSWGPADATALADAVVSRLAPGAAAEVRAAWELAVAGNASWWSEEHNSVIDLRAHLPAADVAREAARRWELPPSQVWHLLAEEFEAVLAGEQAWGDVSGRAASRLAFTSSCRTRRRELPAGLGERREAPDDVVFRQVTGVGGPVDHLGDELLQGYGVSPGVGRGTVRMVRHAEDIVLLRQGDVLVCEATSPSWTPAFDRIAAAVCDGGGLLTHAAIISREYGVPRVCATFTGTTTLRDGDVVEVDGGAGTVRLLWRDPAATSREVGA